MDKNDNGSAPGQNERLLSEHELDAVTGGEIRRSTANGRTDVIKAMGIYPSTNWEDEPFLGSV